MKDIDLPAQNAWFRCEGSWPLRGSFLFSFLLFWDYPMNIDGDNDVYYSEGA